MSDSLKIRENYGTSWLLISFSIIIAVVVSATMIFFLKDNPLAQQICITILLLGFCLGAFIVAFIFRKRSIEYPAFFYFIASLTLWFVSVSFFPVLFLTVLARLVTILATLNFLFSILVLNYASLKYTNLSKTKFFLLSYLVILLLVLASYIGFRTPAAIEALWNKLELVFACVAMVFAITPLVVRIYSKERKQSIATLSSYLFVWIAFCLFYLYYASLRLGLGNIPQFFSIGVLLFSFVLFIVFHVAHSEEITFKDTRSEY